MMNDDINNLNDTNDSQNKDNPRKIHLDFLYFAQLNFFAPFIFAFSCCHNVSWFTNLF